MNRAQRRHRDATVRRAGAGWVFYFQPTTWARDDARWFAAHRDRSHRVRPRLAEEWFVEPTDAPDLDFVAVRQVEPSARLRLPFTLQPSPCLERLREVAKTEAARMRCST
jgi:hypothetical protein